MGLFSEVTKNGERSPLKEKPLRNPGQSLDEQLDQIKWNMLLFLLAPLLLVFLAIWEWWRWYLKSPPQPITATILAIILLGYCIPKFYKLWRRRRDIKQGRDGEKVVGQALDELRQQGYSVFHDVVGKNFNVDHVIVSTHGIFSIETKTYSKPTNVNPEVTVNGENILVAGKSIYPSPVEQAKASAKWLRCDVLHESTGKWFPVKPVVVFPGWWVVEQTTGEVWVLNPKGLQYCIDREPEKLTEEDMHLVAYHLSRFIRAQG
jgi:hypothetical protein